MDICVSETGKGIMNDPVRMIVIACRTSNTIRIHTYGGCHVFVSIHWISEAQHRR
jgi:hypothetical protein